MRTQYDFKGSRSASEVPVLVRYQARNKDKTRVGLYIDTGILNGLRERADAAGESYHPTVNTLLREHLEHRPDEDLESMVRRVVREELTRATQPVAESV